MSEKKCLLVSLFQLHELNKIKGRATYGQVKVIWKELFDDIEKINGIVIGETVLRYFKSFCNQLQVICYIFDGFFYNMENIIFRWTSLCFCYSVLHFFHINEC